MQEDIKKYYDNLFTHNNHLPHAPQTEHIKKRSISDKKKKHNKTKNNITYHDTLPLIQLDRGSCPECDCKTCSYDMWRGEKVCPQCGYVFVEGLAQQPYHCETYRKPQTDYTWEEKQYLRKYGHNHFTTNTKEWINNHDNKTIQSLSCQAQMNKLQKMEVKYIIDTIGFKKLHSRADKPTIICAVIRYVLKQTYKKSTLLRYNQGIFKDLLTKEAYEVVERNINKHLNKKNVFRN